MGLTKFPEQSTDLLLRRTKTFWLKPQVIIGLVIIIYLGVGLLVVHQYGESIDEPPRITYAKQSLRAYQGGPTDLQDEKGPFYGMIAFLGAKVLDQLIPRWTFLVGWNYMSFIAFTIGVVFFYRLCSRILNPIPAIASTLLFSTQPILWGHAFINPKDIPFMSFFLGSITLGLEMVDHWRALPDHGSEPFSVRKKLASLRNDLRAEWATASQRMHQLLITLVGILAIILISYPLSRHLIRWAVVQIYHAPASSLVGRIFIKIAENTSQFQADAYISKAQTFYGYWVVIISLGLMVGLFFIVKRIYPSLIRHSMQPYLILSGCFWGFASDIRTIGPAAGLLIGLYFLFHGRRKAIPYILEYIAVGVVVIYIFWPNLWKNPINGYLASLSEASDYPYSGAITFAGNSYTTENLPPTFLPTLFGLQLTEPAVILFLLGCILSCITLIKEPRLRVDLLLIFAWLIGPVFGAVLFRSTIYNNFRQFLFVLPALFILAGLATQFIWTWLKGQFRIFLPVMMLFLLPGIYWIWQLHPYQYVYYNTLAGGEATASQNYEMDYWFTTYKEGAEYVNRVAHKNSIVYFWNNYETALPFIRPDFRLTSFDDLKYYPHSETLYAVIATRYPATEYIFARSKVVYEIVRGGAVLAVVKEVELADYPHDN